jgi:PilZ domain
MNPGESQVRQSGKAHRRSKRLKLVVPVEVIAFEGEAETFREATEMLSVNAHGGLLALNAPVRNGQTLRLVNRRTTQQLDCRVVNIGSAEDGRWAVGVEFTRPDETFWQISFPALTARIAVIGRN